MTPSGGRGARTKVGAADRRHAILARVAEDQTIHVAELARELGCSEMTIRRDIRRLERDGFIRQTYGGATAHITRSFDISFNARALQATREKRLIGMRAAGLVQDARRAVRRHRQHHRAVRPLPSRARRPDRGDAQPPDRQPAGHPAGGGRDLGRFGSARRAHLCRAHRHRPRWLSSASMRRSMGAAGISARWGITELTQEEAAVQRAALERTERVIILADGSKIGAATPIVVGPPPNNTTLVTDPSAPTDRAGRAARHRRHGGDRRARRTSED